MNNGDDCDMYSLVIEEECR